MSEPVQETRTTRATVEPVDVTPELARRNIRLGWALVGVALLMTAGAVLVAFLYLHFD
jgi:hypothetical protein